MPNVKTFTVIPKLPVALERLREIARNMWWCWDPEAIELFFRIDRDLWIQTNQNPLCMLGLVSQTRLEELSKDDSFLSHLDRVHDRLMAYMATNSWRQRNPDAPEDFRAAYFSAEFGLHESVSLYSGGLGVLAGDHLKSASDLGLPLVGIGLLYREGYFRQYLNADGWQQELYPKNDFYNIAVEQIYDRDGRQMTVQVVYPERTVTARLWKCQVGRVPLYLLDTDFDANTPDDREITARLYGGDRDVRIRQEIMLGQGGVLALHALGISPTVYHMNEGHAAFMTIQRAKELVKNEGLKVEEAIEAVKAASVFTTHTPVPAGNDVFSPDVMRHYFAPTWQELGMSEEQFLGLGRQDPLDTREPFCMTVLALRLSAGANGVSALHGAVARAMWARVWPHVPAEELPLTSITNGVHTQSWISRDLASLYDRYMGPGWVSSPEDQTIWKRIDEVPDAELWRTHERRRERLVNFARRRLTRQLTHRGLSRTEVAGASEALDPEILTIGFARRFATYKRATLLFSDPDRLTRLLKAEGRPVQIILAGKAHPADTQGKDLIRRIVHYARNAELDNHVVFIEDYDINVARYMVQGVDVWLNTPRRPMEASGTSGMKASANGALNISVPDGWWVEAEGLGENGWSIGRGETYRDPDEQDRVESEALYEILEKEVVPLFYDRGRDGLPRHWVARMKNAIRTICPVFNTNRMVQEYTERFYLPCTARRAQLYSDGSARAKALAAWKQHIRRNWDKVRVASTESGPTEGLLYGSSLQVMAEVVLGKLSMEDVTVEIYYGDTNGSDHVIDGRTMRMECVKKLHDGVYRYEGAITCEKTGLQGFTVRVIPNHNDLAQKHETALVTWA
jgi:starch phosphorylase